MLNILQYHDGKVENIPIIFNYRTLVATDEH